MVFYYTFLSKKDRTKYKYCIKNILSDLRITSKKAKIEKLQTNIASKWQSFTDKREKGNPRFQRNYSEIIKN